MVVPAIDASAQLDVPFGGKATSKSLDPGKRARATNPRIFRNVAGPDQELQIDDAAELPVKSNFAAWAIFSLEDHPAFMANHFSALKRARQTEKRTDFNRANRSRLRTALRRFRTALASGNRENAQQMFSETVAALDKAAKKGAIHKNTASRYKSRLHARLNAMKSSA